MPSSSLQNIGVVTSFSNLPTWAWAFERFGFGEGTPYGVISVDGLDSPDIRDDSVEMMAQDGEFTSAQFYGARTITITGDVAAEGSEFAGLVTALRGAFLPRLSPGALRVTIPGWGTRVMYALPMKLGFPLDLNYGLGLAQWVVQLKCPDPRIYDDVLTSISVAAGSLGGITFGATGIQFGGTGLDFGGGGTGQMVATNRGIKDAPVVISFHGPGSTPQLVNQTLGRTLKFNISLEAKDVLVVDTLQRTVMLNGIVNRYNTLDNSSAWWNLAPDANQLQFLIEGASAGATCEVIFRSAWI